MVAPSHFGVMVGSRKTTSRNESEKEVKDAKKDKRRWSQYLRHYKKSIKLLIPKGFAYGQGLSVLVCMIVKMILLTLLHFLVFFLRDLARKACQKH